MDPETEQYLRDVQREYVDFLDDDKDQGYYRQKIQNMIEDNSTRLTININELRKKLPLRANALLDRGFEEMLCVQNALQQLVESADPDYAKLHGDFFVAFEGSFGKRHVSPRTLRSNMIGNLVCCEGIVTKCSLVRPKVVRSVHYCPATNKTMERRYTDMTSYDPFPTTNTYPTEDENKNPLETEYGLSVYKDHQTISIQEAPEDAPPGQLPRIVDVIADNDLVDRCKPGDRVRIIGLYRCLPSKQQGFTAGTFRTIIIANNVQLMSKEVEPHFTKDELKVVRKFTRQYGEDIFEILGASLAPSIHGHDFVKQAILCLLLGGVEKVLPNGTRLRGDINILLIGDPSVAKSQLLRYVLHTAPRAVNTTGRGSSGVGLTAAVTMDPETNERRLEAGAMVLADRGVVCIDEFDKMTEIDRTAIHEVMEQGSVSIAKAGIHARLNARCSVLAAANPVYGRYDLSKSPMDNIGMQDSLLSRFDLLFILLDKQCEATDGAIADHVLMMHRYRAAGEEEGAVLPMGGGGVVDAPMSEALAEERNAAITTAFEEHADWIPKHGDADEKFVSAAFMRKYLHLAKTTKPMLTKEATDYISEHYAELRQSETQKTEKERTTPVTARTLETMIRLATAHAKARLSKKVTEDDARKAYDLLYFACFKEAPRRKRKQRKRMRVGDEEDEGIGEDTTADTEDSMDTTETPGEENVQPKSKRTRQDVYEYDDEDDTTIPSLSRLRKYKGTEPMQEDERPAIAVDRLAKFKKCVREVFDAAPAGTETMEANALVEKLNEKIGAQKFTEGEVTAAFEQMSADNALMLDGDNVILV